MKLNLWIAAAGLATLAGACERAGRESVPTGTQYDLEGTVNGPLPVVLEYDGDCPIRLEGGALTFRDTLYDSEFRIVRHCEDSDSVMADPGTRGGRYELEGDTLIFRSADGGAAGMGIRHGDTLVITGPRHTLVYVRQ